MILKKMILKIVIILAVFLFCPHHTGAIDAPRTFFDALQAYHQGDYQKAVQGFTELVETGIENGPLYYNLGNACLRAGQPGPAILYYERARRLIPTDPDLNFNLLYARSLTRDKPEETHTAWLKVLLFWNDTLSLKTLQWCALVFTALFWLGLMTARFRTGPLLKGITIVTLGLALLFSGTVFARFYNAHTHPQGVVLVEEVPIRSGLNDQATELFRLHAGTIVRIDQTLDHHYRISFTSDKIGWVPQSAIGII